MGGEDSKFNCTKFIIERRKELKIKGNRVRRQVNYLKNAIRFNQDFPVDEVTLLKI